jgi:hypothetical protein
MISGKTNRLEEEATQGTEKTAQHDKRHTGETEEREVKTHERLSPKLLAARRNKETDEEKLFMFGLI